MGDGAWSTNTHEAKRRARAMAGQSNFVHTTATTAKPWSEWRTHESLDPKRTNKKGPHAGLPTRESYDNADHPNSTAIAVVLDVTASNRDACESAHAKLGNLHGLLTRKGYVSDPQVLFAAVGDAYCDQAPLQVGQFESDNRMAEDLENLLLEMGGGGQKHETYELAAYFLANHTDIDCFNKRGDKGYVIFIGDEMPYGHVDRKQVEKLIGDDLPENASTKETFDKLQERFNVFFLFQKGSGMYSPEEVLPAWTDLLGERALVLDDPNAVCESIALLIGMTEGTVTYEDGLEDLKEVGSDLSAIEATGKALATVGANSSALAEATDDLPDVAGSGGTERL